MQIILPKAIGETNIVSTNVPEIPPPLFDAGTAYDIGDLVAVAAGSTLRVFRGLQAANTGNIPDSSPDWWQEIATTHAEWDAGATYAEGDRVIRTTTHKVYQSLQAGNVGKEPADQIGNAAWWVEVGPTNAFALFDSLNGTITTRADEIDVTLAVPGRVDGLALVNISGSEAEVIVSTEAMGEIYAKTHSLIEPRDTDGWYAYFFDPLARKSDLVLTDIPPDSNPTIRVILRDGSGAPSIGSLVVGQTSWIGMAVKGAQVGIQDFSRKEADEFGVYTIVERNFSKRLAVRTIIENADFDRIYNRLAALRATPIVWITEPSLTATVVYGFFRSFAASYEDGEQAHCTLEIEGLT